MIHMQCLGGTVGIPVKPAESEKQKNPAKSRDFTRIWRGFGMWAEPESNRRHKDFQSFALPAELSARANPLL
jgi:hypothetical protein